MWKIGLFTLLFTHLAFGQGLQLSDTVEFKPSHSNWMSNIAMYPPAGGQTTQGTVNFFNVLSQSSAYALIDLLPQNFLFNQITDKSDNQQIIDRIFIGITKTRSGKKICQDITFGSEERIQSVYGTSAEATRQIAKLCKPDAWTAVQPRIKTIFPRDYTIIHTQTDNLAADSWTDRRNHTFIFLKDGRTTVEHLVKVLSHELVVAFDEKEEAGSALGFSAYRSSRSNITELLVTNPEYKAIVQNPLIKYTFVARRAEQIEKNILADLGVAVSASAESCHEAAIRTMLAVARSSVLVIKTESLFSSLLNGQTETTFDYVGSMKKLDTVSVNDSGRSMTLCEYLSVPQVGNSSFSVTTGGPRPRPGGGGPGYKPDLFSSQQSSGLNSLLSDKMTSSRIAPNDSFDTSVNRILGGTP